MYKAQKYTPTVANQGQFMSEPEWVLGAALKLGIDITWLKSIVESEISYALNAQTSRQLDDFGHRDRY